jgi:predicted dehydrogenase
MSQMHGLVVGHGSVGRHHVIMLADLTEHTAVVDSDPEKLVAAKAQHPHITTSDSLESLAELGWEFAETIAIISTWGPSHSDVFHKLADAGVKNIMCEKPLASSLATAKAMMKRAEDDGISVGVHQSHRSAGRAEGIMELAESSGLGKLRSYVVTGGAAGIVTNGIHYIDLAAILFNEWPHEVTSTAQGQPINPRSPDLIFYGGTVVWSFSDNRSMTLTFDNGSRVGVEMQMIFENGVISQGADGSKALVRKIPDNPTGINMAVTRLAEPSEVVFEGKIPGMMDFADATEKIVLDIATNAVENCTMEHGYRSVESVIGAILSGEFHSRVSLPIDENSDAFTREFQIS